VRCGGARLEGLPLQAGCDGGTEGEAMLKVVQSITSSTAAINMTVCEWGA
jgi:hypothetical protein